ncbi:calpain-5-like [Macrosteles quadrilineatus]|uniref:calpain-5-like n=1 Tax=Macrosteles quadrilineatus TaxID=74068 RepID=UPI0023E1762D|nr:calpain-5-like [Macrosteles quadrilineatus]
MGRVKDREANFKKQNYAELRKQHVEEKTLFIDPTFPAVDAIIGTDSIPSNIQWKRPPDICDNPRLFADIETSRVVRPGELSCNWVVSACAVLAGVRELCNRVIPDYWQQEWSDQYCGLFHFQLWRFGVWTDVVVDDLLPTVDNVLLTTQAGANNEFWAALLEKAYAKLHGSYDALREGHLCDALVDFTGGVSEVVDLQAEGYADSEDRRAALLDTLQTEVSDHSIMCFTAAAPVYTDIGTRTPLGLSRGHAYHVTGVKKVPLGETNLRTLFKGREKVVMVRLRDPREEGRRPPTGPSEDGPESEGQYAYSTATLSRLLSSNSDWSRVKESERQRLGLHFNDKAEFWMPLEDVVTHFTELVICRLLNRNLFAVARREWREAVFSDSWRCGAFGTSADRAGGAEDTFLRNPQYICDIKKQEEELLVQLLQFHEIDNESNGFTNFLINFFIIKVEENRQTRLHKQFDHTPTVVRLDHKRKRELNYRGCLAAGRYIIIPTTFRAADTTNYMLRVFSQNDINLRELTNDLPKSLLCSCISGNAEWVTVVTVHNAELNAEPGKWSSKLNPYCVLTCEGSKEKTKVSSDLDPVWESSFVFYRKDIDKPLRVQVLNHNMILPDEVLGESELPALVNHSPTPLAVTLNSPEKPKDPDSPLPPTGVVFLTILSEDNLMAV